MSSYNIGNILDQTILTTYYIFKIHLIINYILLLNPLTSPGEGVTVFTSPYLSAGAPALGEVKGLMIDV